MNKKVVVVDDDQKIVMLIEKVLTQMGFQVFCADNGRVAMDLVRKERPHILISDLLMPGIHGAELCIEIKNDPELEDIIVIIMTGVYNEANYKLEIDCKADVFVEKPLSVERLTEIITRQIEKLG